MIPFTIHWRVKDSLTINAVSQEAAEAEAYELIPDNAEITSVEVGSEYDAEEKLERE